MCTKSCCCCCFCCSSREYHRVFRSCFYGNGSFWYNRGRKSGARVGGETGFEDCNAAKDVKIEGSARVGGGEQEDAVVHGVYYYTSPARCVTESQPFYDRAGKSRRFLHFGAPRDQSGDSFWKFWMGKVSAGLVVITETEGPGDHEGGGGGVGRGRVEPVNRLYSRRKQKAYKTRARVLLSLLSVRTPHRHRHSSCSLYRPQTIKSRTTFVTQLRTPSLPTLTPSSQRQLIRNTTNAHTHTQYTYKNLDVVNCTWR